MNRQLQADGGIMQVTPREKFGLGSKLKRFVRKIIPNEVADIAVKAAPFVAPFNPAVAAAMAGLGSFDQTGKIGSSLKRGALTYGMGQGARYLGGADFQGNPFDPGGAFTGSGFKGGFSSPLGNKTGLGKFFSNQGTDTVQGINSSKPLRKPLNIQDGSIDLTTGGSDGFGIIQDTVTNTPGSAMDSFKSIVSFDTSAGQKTDAAFDLLKRGSKALFYDSEGKLDRAAVIGAVTAAASYAEALALANDAGVELTEEEYNEARKNEKKAEYAGYLQNFFGGKKDGGRIGFKSGYSPGIVSAALEEYNSVYGTDSSGEEILVKDLYSGGFEEFLEIYTGDAYEKRANGGRIGFESGANEMIKTQLLEEIMPDTSTEDMIMIMTEDGPKMIKRSDFEAMPGMFRDTTTSAYGDAGRGRPVPEFANGGRIGFKRGSPEETSEIGIMSIDVESGDDEDNEDMMMAGITFSRAEKSYLFRRLGGSGGASRSYTMPNLYRILSNPGSYPADAAVLKEIAIMGMKKDGGRIGYKGGANRVSELLILRDEKVGKGEDVSDIEAEIFQLTGKTFRSVGGISDVPTGKMRKNNAGVVERDYRDEGGFVPVGIKERADDVPAMLSKNEFVMTADAVRGIGNGSVEEGSKKLYNTMKKAEQVGKA